MASPPDNTAVVGGSIRLWIEPPFPDETTSSVLDRAAGLYEMDRERLISLLLPGERRWGHTRDWDYPLDHHRRAFAAAIGTSDPQDFGVGLWKSDSFLAPLARAVYCPRCFLTDLAIGRPPHFRWQWAIAFATACHRHRTPLMNWRWMRRFQRRLPREWMARPGLQHVGAYEWLIDDLNMIDLCERDSGSQSPLADVLRLQDRLIDFTGGPAANWERKDVFARWQVSDALRDATIRADKVSEPNASLQRPTFAVPGLFLAMPESDWPRLPRNAMMGFRRQRVVGWRRSVCHYLARTLAKPD
jgi:hypothetical protein